MRTVELFGVVVLFTFFVAASARGEDPAKELQGVWRPIWAERDGVVRDRDKFQDETATHTFDGKKMIIKSRTFELVGSFAVDTSKTPMHIDLIPPENVKDPPVPGIFEIRDGVLAICAQIRANPTRPTEMTAKKGSGQSIIKFERVPK